MTTGEIEKLGGYSPPELPFSPGSPLWKALKEKADFRGEACVDVILAGGESTRMQMGEHSKMRCTLEEEPAIIRDIGAGRAAGMKQLVVIGAYAEEVVKNIDQNPTCPAAETIGFVYQAERLGTAHAAFQAARFLEAQGYSGSIMVRPGDMANVKPATLRELRERFAEEDCDMMVVVGCKERFPAFGRVLYRKDGTIYASVEPWDIIKMRLLRKIREAIEQGKSHQDIIQMIHREFDEASLDKSKIKTVLAGIYAGLEKGASLEKIAESIHRKSLNFLVRESDGHQTRLTPEEVEERCDKVNSSLYIFKARPFYKALKEITNDNAQNQYYLTDIIEIFNRLGYTVCGAQIKDDREIDGFNTRAMLERMRQDLENEYFRESEPGGLL
ncbi:MAG: hypothetical protein AMS15_06440 [Planctomycetes bacterium DG_23]|nr:MAG: hypothetical protein AMS15_06440 [Planctomycetes bacterium DG_23]